MLVAKGYSVDLNCQLNDSLAQVSLIQDKNKDGTKQEIRVPDGVNVTQSGQIFTINNVQDSDSGRYHCKVRSYVLRIEKLWLFSYRSRGKQKMLYNVFLLNVFGVKSFCLPLINVHRAPWIQRVANGKPLTHKGKVQGMVRRTAHLMSGDLLYDNKYMI